MQTSHLSEGKEVQRPVIGIFTCLLCERRFSVKSQLNRHYGRAHDLSPHYLGGGEWDETANQAETGRDVSDNSESHSK